MIDSLRQLFVEQVKDLYHAERQLLHAIPRMSAETSCDELKEALDHHRAETREHVARLEKIFEVVGEPPAERKCRAMLGLVAETDELLRDCSTPEVRDAAIIASAQRIQHYEIAGYGVARTYARMLGENEAAQLLQRTLDEEGKTDEVLTVLAKGSVNRQAMSA